jgi:peroxiredoxin
MLSYILLIFACSEQKVVDPEASIIVEDEQIEQSELNGTLITESFPAPDFIALNQDGVERTKADLQGKPTVIWFYPAANTPG